MMNISSADVDAWTGAANEDFRSWIAITQMTVVRVLIAVAVCVFLSQVVVVAFILNVAERSVMQNVLALAANALATVALFYAARQSSDISKRLSTAWATLAIGMLCYTIGAALCVYLENVAGEEPFPSIADLAYLSYYPLVLVGLFRLPTVALAKNERLRRVANIGIVMVASAMVFGRFLFSPLLSDVKADPAAQFLSLLYPTLGLMLFWTITLIVLRQGGNTGPLIVLAIGALSLCTADLMHYHDAMRNAYRARDIIINIAYALVPLLTVMTSALHITTLHGPTGRFGDGASVLDRMLTALRRLQRTVSMGMPYVWVGLAFCLMVIEVSQPHTDGINANFILDVAGVGLTLVLVLIRQTLTLRQNAQLSSRLTRLVDASQILAAPLNSNAMPTLILSQVGRLIEYDFGFIMLFEPTNMGTLYRCAYADFDELAPAASEQLEVPMPITSMTQAGLSMVLTPPYLGWHRNLVHWLSPQATTSLATLGTALIVPMVVDQRSVGLLAVGHSKVDHYSLADLDVITSFAHQAGATLENARLRRQEVAAAAQAERSRLARELHDSVSQALFGITLGARTTRELIARDAPRAVDAVDYVLNLANGAQAEMRALIFELRPEMLATEGLIEALRKQSDALCKRHGMSVTFEANCSEPDIPLNIKEALYRIAMEAIQNTIRHAQATQVDIALICIDAVPMGLIVRDNGRGFDPHAPHHGHFGLHSMRERATHIGATLNVTSAIGAGSAIHVSLPL